ncbi:Fe2+-dependent dioxygenase [Escherichia coli]
MEKLYDVPHSRRVIATGLACFREQLEQAEWVDERVTTGAQKARKLRTINRSTPAARYTPPGKMRCWNAVNQHALFFAAALPRTLSTPLFNRYQNNETYGFHVDGAVRSHPQNGWMRTDLSATLFLSDPQSYDGGERLVNDTFGQHRVKLPAGDLVLNPSSSLHCVTPVTRGEPAASYLCGSSR